MYGLFVTILGFIVIGYFGWTGVQVILLLIDSSDRTWSDMSFHIGLTGVVCALIAVSEIHDRLTKNKETKNTSKATGDKDSSSTDEERSGSLKIVDELRKNARNKPSFGIYQQSFETWWYDDYGDKHYHSTIYATLRFYEDGTVIGSRTTVFPKNKVKDSFTLSGKWEIDNKLLSFDLEKVSDVYDTINIYISPEEQREMKYYGRIADDSSLIKAGHYEGYIHDQSLQLDGHTFQLLPLLKLVVTADEDDCSDLVKQLSNNPIVVSCYEGTGNWYTNGETGPEWFTATFITSRENKERLEELVSGTGKLFWDNVNL